jgi:hydrogenase nickel incorporation protein HypA/HybF
MHELAIADAVLSVTLEQAAERRVARVGMRVGHLRQIAPSALRFSFALVARDTCADGAELEIEQVPVVVWCDRCAAESRPVAFPLLCGQCGTSVVAVTGGNEMSVDWIETEAEV